MRKLPLRTVAMEFEDGRPPVDLDYRAMFVARLREPAPGSGGVDYEAMGLAIAVIDKVKSGDDCALLEEAEWKLLADRLKSTKWQIVHEAVRDMVLAVVDAKEVQVAEKPSSAAA